MEAYDKKSCLLNKNSCTCHIIPKLPKVKPTAQKKANSARSLHPEGIEFKTTLIR